jgi:hypothetical protein
MYVDQNLINMYVDQNLINMYVDQNLINMYVDQNLINMYVDQKYTFLGPNFRSIRLSVLILDLMHVRIDAYKNNE